MRRREMEERRSEGLLGRLATGSCLQRNVSNEKGPRAGVAKELTNRDL